MNTDDYVVMSIFIAVACISLYYGECVGLQVVLIMYVWYRF